MRSWIAKILSSFSPKVLRPTNWDPIDWPVARAEEKERAALRLEAIVDRAFRRGQEWLPTNRGKV